MHSVATIIPTTCESRRKGFLLNSIDSVLSQKGVINELVVVVNGNLFDKSLLETLQNDKQFKVIYLEEGNVSRARLAGLRFCQSDYFCFLDDDDEFLEDGLYTRLSILLKNPEVDVVVTNGYIRTENHNRPLVNSNVEIQINENPVLAFFDCNWFASPASMFRKTRNNIEHLFEMDFRYFEWTFLLFTLIAEDRRIIFDSAMTYRKMEDNDYSVSKSEEYLLNQSIMIKNILDLELDSYIKKLFQKRLQNAYHTASEHYLRHGGKRDAWYYHYRSLKAGGLRFLPYTLKLIGLRE